MKELKVKKVDKPWGILEQLTHETKSTIQVLKIMKWEELSIHFHKVRDDYWYIVNWEWVANIDGKQVFVKWWELIFLEKYTPHSIRAISNELIILEICFDTFKEEDTYRVQDKYGRV